MVVSWLVLDTGKQAVNPLPTESGIIFSFSFFSPQACPRLSIFSATSPQQTETAHASLHARDPAQPYNARIFRRLDASKCFSLPLGLAPFERVKEKLTGKKMASSGWRVELCANWLWVPSCPSLGILLAFLSFSNSLVRCEPIFLLATSKFATSREWNLLGTQSFMTIPKSTVWAIYRVSLNWQWAI